MIRVEILEPSADDDPDGWTSIGTITADGSTVATTGDERKLDRVLMLPVPDPADRRRTLTARDSAEAWAANLPAVLRGPALIARLTAT